MNRIPYFILRSAYSTCRIKSYSQHSRLPAVLVSSQAPWLTASYTVKRRLVDFAWNRRFFYLPGACPLFGGSTRLKVTINPICFIRSACFDQSSSQSRVNPGKHGGGGAKKLKTSASFLFEASCSQRQQLQLFSFVAQVASASTSQRTLPSQRWLTRQDTVLLQS